MAGVPVWRGCGQPSRRGSGHRRRSTADTNYRKLVALKDKYDPANVFRFNHNIVPSHATAHRVDR
jgi:hypothetical protein